MAGSRVKEFYSHSSGESPKGNFHEVITLHEGVDVDWSVISARVPSLCKGWYELSQLPSKDRIEFTQGFWIASIPYHPRLSEFVSQFFDQLDSIEVFITQQKFDDPFVPHLVYSFKDDNFYSGCSPATEKEIEILQAAFPDRLLPSDYLAFLRIHNGFCKTTDCTGLSKSHRVIEGYPKFQDHLLQLGAVTTNKGVEVDPKALLPFYESFGMPFYQCFWSDWYPAQEMGNVYYSGVTHTISDVPEGEGGINPSESLSFPTFTDWLMFYLERID